MPASGCCSAARSSASSPRARRKRLEPGLAQDHAERSEDLLLVVDDQHARPGLIAHVGSGVAGSGARSGIGRAARSAARPRSSSPGRAASRPRSSRRWPRRSPWRSPARGQSRPTAPREAGCRTAIKRLEDPGALGRADPGALVDHAHHRARSAAVDVHRHGLPARVAQRVLDQVGERSLEVGGVGADRRDVGLDRDPDLAAGGSPAHRAGRPGRPAPRPRARPSPGAARPGRPEAARGRAACRRGRPAARPPGPPPRSARCARRA